MMNMMMHKSTDVIIDEIILVDKVDKLVVG